MESKKWREISQRFLCLNGFISTDKKIIHSRREEIYLRKERVEMKREEKKRNYQTQAYDRHQLVQHQDKETFHR